MSSILPQLIRSKQASAKIGHLSTKVINQVLKDLAAILIKESTTILKANAKDLQRMDPKDPKYDRLKLTHEILKSITEDVKNVARLESPLHKVIEKRTLPNGLKLRKVTVPLGLIGIIYEARPNVTVDAFSLCLKSSSACILKGGSDAYNSNKAIVALIQKILKKHGITEDSILLLPPHRESIQELFTAHSLVDVIIPRGSQKLINFVRENSKIPVIETGAGIVHTYIDRDADINMAKSIIFNAKTRRPSVCNALDTLIINEKQLPHLPKIVAPLNKTKVEIFADYKSFQALSGKYDKKYLRKAKKEHFGIEFLSLKMSIKTVKDLKQALEHIQRYSSKHSEAIISNNKKNIRAFLENVDAAAVYANTSTAFTDGAQFGLGAEIGISTQKLHARGPIGLRELVSYKWIIQGNGQIRT